MLSCLLTAQTDSLTTDTSKIYKITDVSPLFPGCENVQGDNREKLDCTNKQVLSFMYKYIQYPLAALEDSLEGQVVVQFVVEKDGRITNAEILRDIGGGCGEEVVRIVEAMNGLSQSWTAGQKNGEFVRSYFTLPIRFKLPEYKEPEFSLDGRDTIWLKYDTPSSFKQGEQALQDFISNNLRYPTEGVGKCMIGEMDVQILVLPNGRVKVVDILDYSGTGIDFLYEAIAMTHRTHGLWEVAQKAGRPVGTTQTLRLSFAPPTDGCKQRVEEYKTAKAGSEEAVTLFEAGNAEEAIAKWNNAIGLFPNNAEWLSYRGQAFLNNNDLSLACQDLGKAQRILQVFWYNDILALICKAPAPDPAAPASGTAPKELMDELPGEDNQ